MCGRCASCCCHIACTPSLAFLDQCLLGHSYGMRYAFYPGLSLTFLFVQIFWEGFIAAIGMLFYWIMPYSHSHSLSVYGAGFSGRALCSPLGCCSIGNSYSHSHSQSVLWAFWRALCGHWDAVLLDNAYSHSHSLLYCRLFWEGFMQPWDAFSIG